ncbi:MAG: alpha/beta hydrolase, partial [Nitrososphaeraceae archaeon]|nr:alpha/beta hydrolase [Nitrososphaeraceae archaeon]
MNSIVNRNGGDGIPSKQKELYYIEQGEGQPVIFIHGTLDDFRAWHFQIDQFAEKYHVVSYSRRYAYPNQWPGNGDDNTIINNAADVVDLIIKKLNLAPAHIIGHSYGAFTALYVAYQHPEIVRTLVLGEPPIHSLLESNPKFVKMSQGIKENVYKRAQEALSRGQTEEARRIFIDGVMSKEGFFDQLPLQARSTMIDNAKSLSEGSFIMQPFTCEDAQRVTIPTLLVRGELSPKFLHHIIDTLARCIPDNEQITIPDESHDLGRSTKPKLFNGKVIEFRLILFPSRSSQLSAADSSCANPFPQTWIYY